MVAQSSLGTKDVLVTWIMTLDYDIGRKLIEMASMRLPGIGLIFFFFFYFCIFLFLNNTHILAFEMIILWVEALVRRF